MARVVRPPKCRETGGDAFDFPDYSGRERKADAGVHWIGVAASIIASAWMLVKSSHLMDVTVTASLTVYCFGLVSTFCASAAYNLTTPGPRKEWLRRIDHAVIFVMIAGSYTPYAAASLGGEAGLLLLGALWTTAFLGVVLKLLFPRRFERLSLLLYLAMGWLALVVVEPLIAAISSQTLWLLAAGGIVYSLGAGVHSLRRLPFHNAVWHAMVLLAAGLHFVAASVEFLL